ncbi:hypothetical protein DVH05_004430 [Phytophthora capsici]|nr:hypothetical protein DVH05_004430 [Phytophthora capsici]|eukprot:jgi/Phyca11/512143/fgenesh2_kg.PHYCAscaffold_270_\
MKSDPPSRVPPSVDVFDERLYDVFSFRAAIPLLEGYLSSIQIDDDNPAFLFDWQEDNVNAFVDAANNLPAAEAPPWLRPGRITASSLIDDIIYRLQPDAGARCGHVMLAPNNQEQFLAIAGTLISLQNDTFLQDAAQAAIPVVNNVEQYLAVTYHLTDSRVHRARPNNLPPNLQNGNPLRRLFI